MMRYTHIGVLVVALMSMTTISPVWAVTKKSSTNTHMSKNEHGLVTSLNSLFKNSQANKFQWRTTVQNKINALRKTNPTSADEYQQRYNTAVSEAGLAPVGMSSQSSSTKKGKKQY